MDYRHVRGAHLTNVLLSFSGSGMLITHNDFGGRAFFAYTAITGESNSDLNGHGTHVGGTVGGTVYGVAKKANLYAVKVKQLLT